MASDLEKLEAILEYAKEDNNFDDSFALELYELVEDGKSLTPRQKMAIDNILDKFGIECD